ncbi:MAG: SDR family oxidoreductase [Pseudomonadota bacterium]
MVEPATLVSFGHGYSAQALARLLLPAGWQVRGTTRSAEKAEVLRAQGIEAVIWPPENPDALLAGATHLLMSAAPDEFGDPVLAHMARQIAAAAPQIRWMGYLSTTGVYGDWGGGHVDETSECRATSRRGLARIAAEEEWQALQDLPVHIFRLAGIYGPGRGPFAKVRAGTARRIIKPGQLFSRTHVEDIAKVLEASIASPRPGAVYNVCDDEPAPPEDVLGYAAELLRLSPPPEIPFEDAEMSPMARSFYMDSRRVSNRLIREELGVDLAFPTYREGLAALLAEEEASSPS